MAPLTTLFAIVLVTFVPSLNQACEFPEFVQSRRDGPAREWHVQQLEYHRRRQHKHTHVITVEGDTLEAVVRRTDHNTHVDDKPRSYRRRCVLEIEPGQFLINHNDNQGSVQKYLCIEFIKRSETVIQIKQSNLSNVQDPRLCADSVMTLNHWPLIDKTDLFSTNIPCPLEGGYFARFYDKQTRVGYCDVYEGETMVESECMKGEGMFFRFRYDKCIPDGLHMRADQQLFCLADWEHGDYRFVVFRHDSLDQQWCFRYPNRLTNQFSGELFHDIVCDPEKYVEGGNKHLTISLSRAPSQPSTNLCKDDHEGCEYWTEPCSQPGSTLYMTCAKMCNMCNDTVPSKCIFPRKLWGEWLESNRNGHDIVDIKDTTLAKYKYETFECIRWNNNRKTTEDNSFEEMLVSTFDNGCKPRYTCAQFKMHAPSVLHYKLSQSRVWPFYGTEWNNIGCDSFHYKDGYPPLGDAHHSRHLKALISMDAITNVDCGLDHPIEFSVTVENDISCHGMLTVKDSSIYKDKRLQLLLYDCPNTKALQEFTCLDSRRHGYVSRQMIITESADNTNEYQCWYFPVSPENIFYQIPMMHCNEAAGEKILSGSLQPMSTYRMKITTTTTTTTTTPPHSPHIIVENIVSIPTGDKHMNKTGDATHEKGYPEDNVDNEVVKMNDPSNAGLSQPGSYSHISEKSHPEGEMLVSPDSDKSLNNKRLNGDTDSVGGNHGYRSRLNVMLLVIGTIVCTYMYV